MTTYVRIGYNDAIQFKRKTDAWAFVNDVFNAAFTAENPEIMGISICFVREEEKEDENNAV
jgi:hypothetical protein